MNLNELLDGEQVAKATDIQLSSVNTDPNQYAEDTPKAEYFGVTPEVLADNRDAYYALANQEMIDIKSAGPVMREYMSVWEKQALIANDIPEWERLNFFEKCLAAYDQGSAQFDLGTQAHDLANAAETVHKNDPIGNLLSNGANEDIVNDPELLSKVQKAFLPQEEQLRLQEMKQFEKATKDYALMSALGQKVKQPKVLEDWTNAKGAKASWDVFWSDPLNLIGYTTGTSLAQQLVPMMASVPAFMAGAVPGALATGLGSGYTEYWASFGDYMTEQGIDPTDADGIRAFLMDPENLEKAKEYAAQRAQGVSFFDALGGLVAAGSFSQIVNAPRAFGRQINKAIRGKSVAPLELSKVARAVRATNKRVRYMPDSPNLAKIGEIFGQSAVGGVLGGAGEVAAQLNAGQELDWGNILLEVFGEFGTMPVEIGIAQTGMAMGYAKKHRKAQIAKKVPMIIEGLTKVAAISNLRQRNPKEFVETIEKMSGNTQMKEVFVASDKVDDSLAQSIIERAPELAPVIDEARKEGGDIRIPMSVLLSKLSDSPEVIGKLKDHIRIDENGMSSAEADAWVKENRTFLDRHFNSVLNAQLQNEAYRKELQEAVEPLAQQLNVALRETMARRLVEQGTMTEAEAIKHADQVTTYSMRTFGAVLARLSALAGMTPKQFMERYPNEVQAIYKAVSKDAEVNLRDDEIASLDQSTELNQGATSSANKTNLDDFIGRSARRREAVEQLFEVTSNKHQTELAKLNKRGKKNYESYQQALEKEVKAAAKKAGINLDDRNSPVTRDFLVQAFAKAMIDGLDTIASSAIGWYDRSIITAVEIAKLTYPELEDKNMLTAFMFALAVTSNGQEVEDNYNGAMRAYAGWDDENGVHHPGFRDTALQPNGTYDATKGVFNTESNQGIRTTMINDNLLPRLYKQYQTMSADEVQSFLMTTWTVRQLRLMGEKVSGETIDQEVVGSTILGPKLGRFFANLMGKSGELTMDMWFMRTFDRLTGTVFDKSAKPQKQVTAEKVAELRALLDEYKKNADVVAVFKEHFGWDITKKISDKKLEEVARQASSLFGKDKNFRTQVWPSKLGKDLGDVLRKAINGVTTKAKTTIEAPKGASDREYIRGVFNDALENVRQNVGLENLSVADAQALLWYVEKLVYGEGINDKTQPNFAKAAVKYAKAHGIDETTTTAVINRVEEVFDNGQNGKRYNELSDAQKRKIFSRRYYNNARRIRQGNSDLVAVRGSVYGLDKSGGKASRDHSRGSAGNGGRFRSVVNGVEVGVVGVWEPRNSDGGLGLKFSLEEQSKLKFGEIRSSAVPNMLELEIGEESAKVFHNACKKSKSSQKYGACVELKSVDELSGLRLFLSEDGSTGFALKNGDDIVSVFGDSKAGGGAAAIECAIAAGGRRLDCFNTILPHFYAEHGFVPVARLKFNRDYAPDGWDYDTFKRFNNGEPDIVFMVLNDAVQNQGVEAAVKESPYVDDYDQAEVLQAEGVAKYADVNKNLENAVTGNPETSLSQSVLNQSGWHGSPYVFDLFSLEHIGTGEGAQAHGWGLYFSADRFVAQRYRDVLSEGEATKIYINGKAIPEIPMSYFTYRERAEYQIGQYLETPKKDVERYSNADVLSAIELAKKKVEEHIKRCRTEEAKFKFEEQLREIEEIENNLNDHQFSSRYINNRGRLFMVEIPDSSVMLDEQKTLAEQPEYVRNALYKLGIRSATGVFITHEGTEYRHLAKTSLFGEWIDGKGNFVKPGTDLHKALDAKLPEGQQRSYGYNIFNDEDTGRDIYRKLSNALGSPKAASLALNEVGIKGITYDGSQDGRCFVIFDDKAIKILEFYQEQMNEKRRAAYDPSQGITKLFELTDESSFLHESGHHWLNTLALLCANIVDIPVDQRTPGEQELVEILDGFLKWAKTEGDTAEARIRIWNSMTLDQQRAFHEQFARGYEAYLRNGKAPTSALGYVFAKFKEWLVQLYKSAADLDVEMTPEVTALYDRLFMSETEAQATIEEQNANVLFTTARAAGMSDEEFANLQKAYTNAKEALEAAIRTGRERNHALLHKRYEREKRGLQEAYEAMLKNARKALEQSPVYMAIDILTNPSDEGGIPFRFKLSLAEVNRMFNNDVAKIDAIKAKGLITNHSERFIPVQVLADMVGAPNAMKLLDDIADASPIEEEAVAMAEAQFLAEYGNLPNEEGLDKAALMALAMHDPAFSKVLESEYNALAKLTGGRKLAKEGASKYAREKIGALPVKSLRPHAHARAEARAGKEAERAFKRGDLINAALHKRNQVLQHHIARAGFEARQEVAKGLRYVKRILKSKTIWGGHMEQIENIAARFGLANIAFNPQARTLDKFVEDMGLGCDWDIAVMEPIEDAEGNIVYRYKEAQFSELTMDEFRGVIDAIKTLEKTGRDHHNVTVDGRKVAIKDQVEKVNKSIEENATEQGREFTLEYENSRPNVERKRSLLNFFYKHFKIASWARIMDGDKLGEMWQTFIKRANACADLETEMRAQLTKTMQEILAPVIAQGDMYGDGIALPGTNRVLCRQERIAFALNWGNDGNRQRLLDGYNITADQAMEVLQYLTESEWQAVQQIWDVFESLRPQMQALEERMYGRGPRWIESSPFEMTTREGVPITLRGGYYPAVYDRMANEVSERYSDMSDAEKMMKAAVRSIHTDRSHMKKRANKVFRPILLDMKVSVEALQNEVHDLCWREFVVDTQKLLNGGIKSQIKGYYGYEVATQFSRWLADIALGDQRPREGSEKFFARLRQGVGLAGLGFNVVSAMAQVTGLMASATRLGGYTGVGIQQYISNPRGATKEVCEASSFMKNRGLHRWRELNEVNNLIKTSGSKAEQVMDTVRSGGYYLMLKVQQVVDTITWLGAYQQAIDEGNTVADARAMADQVVIDTQGSGMIKDLAEFERGGALHKLFTVFYSFMNTAYNLNATALLGDRNRYRAAAKVLTLSVIMPIVEGMIRAALPVTKDEDDEDEDVTVKLMQKAAGDVINFNMGTMVGVRELATLANVVTGEPVWGYQGPAGTRVFSDTIRLGQQVAQGEFDVALVKALVNLGGSLYGVPAAQINRAISTGEAYAEGEIEEPIDVVRGALLGVSMK